MASPPVRSASCTRATNHSRGFTLLEIVLALFILGTMASLLAPSVAGVIEKSRLDAEGRALSEIAEAITSSFEHADLASMNIAALPGHVGMGDGTTEFSTSTHAAYSTTNNASWFAKVARVRGLNPQLGVPPHAPTQPALALIAYNAVGNPRLLIAAPDEPGRQRFLLVSLMARAEQLTLPAYENTLTWFDAIWDNNWENRTAATPSFWQTRLSMAQLSAWAQGPGGTTSAYRLCVRRLVLPKYRLTVNNNHPTNSAFVSFNNVSNAFTAPANSGAHITPEILGGRVVIVSQGAAAPGVETLRLRIHSNDTIIVQ
jgi:prepilin-type N-terminal cleavage/methylation domain-containing protein